VETYLRPRLGEIGEPSRKIEVIPETPAVRPAPSPSPAPERVPEEVPA
jgi:hypothetical protein